MSGDTEDLITDLKLMEPTTDERLSNARALALQYLRSKAPIPKTVMTVVERGAITPAASSTESAAEDSSTSTAENADQNADQNQDTGV